MEKIIDQKNCFGSKKELRLKKDLNKKKKKKMNIARQIFNNQHLTSDLIDLFGKRYKINENDKTFH